MLDNIAKKLLANQIISNTNHQHCFLFIGKNATEEDITESICKLKWSAIIHESDNFDYASKFAVNDKYTDSYILNQNNPIPNKKISHSFTFLIMIIVHFNFPYMVY